jgi:drug/metabolite transporter (DMT)-like permease
MDFNGQYGNFMMMLATGLGAYTTILLYIKSDRKEEKTLLKESWYFPVLAGGVNAVQNLLIILLATSTLSPNIIYPVLSIGSLMVVTIFSAFVFKEKMCWWQWIGIGVGIIAIALLS